MPARVKSNSDSSLAIAKYVVRTVGRETDTTLLLFGMALVVVALVDQVGPWKFKSGASRSGTLAVGLLSCILGIVWIAYRRRSFRATLPDTLLGKIPKYALEPDFLLKIFVQGMPPAFVKEYTSKKSGRHIIQSAALADIQQLADNVELRGTDPGINHRRSLIKADHRAGDELAASSGISRQLELADTLEGECEVLILTTKHCIVHRKKQFIVGWAIPVKYSLPQANDKIYVEQQFHQVLQQLSPTTRGEGLQVTVGKALRHEEKYE